MGLDLHTKGETIQPTNKCELPLSGQVGCNPKSITTFIRMSEMVEKYRVTFDSHKEDAFVVHLPIKDIKL